MGLGYGFSEEHACNEPQDSRLSLGSHRGETRTEARYGKPVVQEIKTLAKIVNNEKAISKGAGGLLPPEQTYRKDEIQLQNGRSHTFSVANVARSPDQVGDRNVLGLFVVRTDLSLSIFHLNGSQP